MSNIQKLLLLSIVILAGICFIGYSIYQSTQKFRETEKFVEKAERIIYQAMNILSLGKDIETASRGFILTNDSTFLEPLYDSQKKVFAYIKQIKHLTIDNPKQQKNIDSLNFYMHKRLDHSIQSIEILNKYGPDSAMIQILTKIGKKYTDRLREIVNSIQREESIMLKQKKQANEQSIKYFYYFSIVMFAIMTVVIVLLLIATINILLKNKQKAKLDKELVVAKKEIDIVHDEKEKQVEANKELEAFSYSVSHDLRAPLRHVIGFVDLLRKTNSDKMDEKGLRYLDIIAESALEMGNLIDALLTFSRLSRTDIQMTTIDSKTLVTNVLKTFSEELINRNIEINVSELPDAKGDESLITQVWINLISNAIKYSRNEEKAIIEIGGRIDNGKAIFFVKDNGVGFDMKYADKLFGVFQRLHKAKDFEGVGIGLANVNRIVTRHGGICWVESEVGKGAKFFFNLMN
jgi:signal transduction histidine kinase